MVRPHKANPSGNNRLLGEDQQIENGYKPRNSQNDCCDPESDFDDPYYLDDSLVWFICEYPRAFVVFLALSVMLVVSVFFVPSRYFVSESTMRKYRAQKGEQASYRGDGRKDFVARFLQIDGKCYKICSEHKSVGGYQPEEERQP